MTPIHSGRRRTGALSWRAILLAVAALTLATAGPAEAQRRKLRLTRIPLPHRPADTATTPSPTGAPDTAARAADPNVLEAGKIPSSGGNWITFEELGRPLVLRSPDNIDRLGVYLYARDSVLYATSNFSDSSKTGAYYLRIRDSTSLDAVAANLLYDGSIPWELFVLLHGTRILDAVRDSVTFIAAHQLFKHPVFGRLDVDKGARLQMMNPVGELSPVRRFRTAGGEPGEAFGAYTETIWGTADDFGTWMIMGRMPTHELRRDELRVLSLTTDAEANRRLDAAFSDIRVPFDFSSPGALQRELRRHRGTRLLVIGEVRNDAFRVRDASGGELFTIPVHELSRLARECCRIQVVPLGSVPQPEGTPGPAVFTPADVASRLARAFSEGTSEREFWTAMAGSDLRLVVRADPTEQNYLHPVYVHQVLDDDRFPAQRLVGQAATMGEMMRAPERRVPWWAWVAGVLVLLFALSAWGGASQRRRDAALAAQKAPPT